MLTRQSLLKLLKIPSLLNKKWFVSSLFFALVVLLSLGLGATGGFLYQNWQNKNKTDAVLGQERSSYLVFTEEIYHKIKNNHWKVTSEEELVNLYFLAIEKLTGQIQASSPQDLSFLLVSVENILEQIETEEAREDFVVQLNNLVLNNLEPFGRSQLYRQKEKQELNDMVLNVAKQDHYQVLGLNKEASQEEISQAHQNLNQTLSQDSAPEAKEKLAQVGQAYRILGNESARQIYDVSGVEPTIEYRLIRNNIFHLHLKSFSPATFDELQRATQKVQGLPGVDTLVLDLRNNIGGAIDNLPYLLGPFIGQDRHAYQFFHQGKRIDYKTRIGWLPSLFQYKKVVILINENSQSSAEVVASVLKKYNVGVLVGNTTRGWGTVEKIFRLETQINQNETYSLFLAHSLTLREDGQPIEGLGVEPHIFTSNPNWQRDLYSYLPDQNIVDTVEQILAENNPTPLELNKETPSEDKE